MKFDKSSNPTFNSRIWERTSQVTYSSTMTVQGAINKTALLFIIMLLTGSIVWRMPSESMLPWAIGGAILGLITAIVLAFKPNLSPILAPVYAIFEGLFIGAISALFESMFSGIVMQAIGLTLGVMFAMLFCYKMGIIRATERFRSIIITATSGIALFYVLNMIFSMFDMGLNFFALGWLGIGISLVIVVVAALNLILDFNFIEQGAHSQAPKYMEWYAAFGLMVTLVWLYIEILRLLSLLANRD